MISMMTLKMKTMMMVMIMTNTDLPVGEDFLFELVDVFLEEHLGLQEVVHIVLQVDLALQHLRHGSGQGRRGGGASQDRGALASKVCIEQHRTETAGDDIYQSVHRTAKDRDSWGRYLPKCA